MREVHYCVGMITSHLFTSVSADVFWCLYSLINVTALTWYILSAKKKKKCSFLAGLALWHVSHHVRLLSGTAGYWCAQDAVSFCPLCPFSAWGLCSGVGDLCSSGVPVRTLRFSPLFFRRGKCAGSLARTPTPSLLGINYPFLYVVG